jgi:hypothetical protein
VKPIEKKKKKATTTKINPRDDVTTFLFCTLAIE